MSCIVLNTGVPRCLQMCNWMYDGNTLKTIETVNLEVTTFPINRDCGFHFPGAGTCQPRSSFLRIPSISYLTVIALSKMNVINPVITVTAMVVSPSGNELANDDPAK